LDDGIRLKAANMVKYSL